MVKFVTEEEVAALMENGSTVAMAGFGGMSQCEKILKGIRNRFLQENQPNNLTIYHPSGQSDGKNGIEHIALEGLVKRVIGAHWGLAPKMSKLIEENKVEAYCLPQGQLTHLFRTIANKLPGHISPIGLRTFVDPRINGGKVNQVTENKEDIIDVVHIDNQEYLFYKSVPFDYVLIRGTTIDENGNLSTEEEPLKLEILTAAQAAKASGGKVIVQAKYLAKKNTLHPKEVQVPGFLVDYVVIADDYEVNHRQTPDYVYNPVYNGNLIEPEHKSERTPMNERKIIGNRAYLELQPNSVINLGIGIPGDVIGPIIKEKGRDLNIISTVESGPIGGVPAGKNQFGISKNPEAIISQASQFDFYHGAAVDVTFMGAGEIDQYGNVNVSKFSNRIVGCGGFMDITQAAKKVVFCSTFTAGGFAIDINDSSISINREGKIKKFVENVDLISFSGEFALEQGIEVYYITERAVFVLTTQGLRLIEIAEGIDLEKDVLGQMEFQPIISSSLRKFDPSIYTDEEESKAHSNII
ncbi:acyl CoA:acetate/3-ketoacid CoA transferase [Oceanobacillus alkalisoli]|uniref:acyl CoA:acetate/3-ketoacid CoA transferase n=1 Tax=Oceanobacillus alkalisoli TaxID=2925113 RepID=UPI001F11ECA5|nr:CoA-transferase [Oceanobacillus alkalisoli]MCF3942591.1 acyl CoA:acetate/3-ketoacid CoA transferase [Oceanobacillus alkalisoli]